MALLPVSSWGAVPHDRARVLPGHAFKRGAPHGKAQRRTGKRRAGASGGRPEPAPVAQPRPSGDPGAPPSPRPSLLRRRLARGPARGTGSVAHVAPAQTSPRAPSCRGFSRRAGASRWSGRLPFPVCASFASPARNKRILNRYLHARDTRHAKEALRILLQIYLCSLLCKMNKSPWMRLLRESRLPSISSSWRMASR